MLKASHARIEPKYSKTTAKVGITRKGTNKAKRKKARA